MNSDRGQLLNSTIGPALARAWRGAVGHPLVLMIGVWAVLVASGMDWPLRAAEPQIIRARVPAKDLSKVFPPGTELRILSIDEFDARVNDAAKASAAAPSPVPRLVRARHYARWKSGALLGRTELVLDAPAGGDLVLKPWSPAVLPTGVTGGTLGALDTGTAILTVERSSAASARIEWELAARPYSAERRFALALPVDQTSTIALEIPKGWIPNCQQEIRGPIAASSADQATWIIDAGSGTIDLLLSDAGQSPGAIGGAHAWLTTSTQVDLRSSDTPSQNLANWKTDCRIELDPRHPRMLEMELDAGLELIDIRGNLVRGYQTSKAGTKTRLVVNLEGESAAPLDLRITAHAPVPADGLWSIPAMRPIDATWTGGTTTLIFDEFHSIRECREKAGRRTAPARGGIRNGSRMVFVSQTPDSVADVLLGGPLDRVSCQVSGQLAASAVPARIECQLRWNLDRGAIPGVEIELSPGWSPDRVSLQGLNEAVAWHASTAANGSNRLAVTIPTAAAAAAPLVILLEATRVTPSGTELDLPRVRPVGARIIDEIWLGWTDANTTLAPRSASGLAWLDADELPPGWATPARPSEPARRPALAWRWIADRAAAVVDRQPIEKEPTTRIRTIARVLGTGRELELDGAIEVTAGANALAELPFAMEPSPASLADWRFDDAATGAVIGVKRVDTAGVAKTRSGAELAGWNLAVDLPRLSKRTIHFHARTTREPQSPIPLFVLPRGLNPRATVWIVTPEGMHSEVSSRGLRRLSPPVATPAIPGADRSVPDSAGDATVVSHAVAYDLDPNPRLELTTESLIPRPSPGVVTEARLTTAVGEGDLTLNRLTLLVQPGEARELGLTLGVDTEVVRVHVDGSVVAPVSSGEKLLIPLLSSAALASGSNVVIDYQARATPAMTRPLVPEFTIPCLGFSWELAIAPGWTVARCGSGLVDQNMARRAQWPATLLGLPALDVIMGEPAGRGLSPVELRGLDEQMAGMPAEGFSFGEWFTRWDQGDVPLMIDRPALDGAGFSARSQCIPPRLAAKRQSVSLATLRQYGLAVVPVAGTLFLTTTDEAARFRTAEPWSRVIAEALAWGGDRTDRWQTLARWRSLESPAPAAGFRVDRRRLLPGWTTWRFARSSWPDGLSYVELVDPRQAVRLGWLVVLAGLIFWSFVRARTRLNRFYWPWGTLVASVFVGWLWPAPLGVLTAGIFVSTLIVVVFELSRGPWGSTAPVVSPRIGSTVIKRAVTVGSAVVLVCPLVDLGVLSAAEGIDPKSAILALFPYDDPFDPNQPPDQVHMRLSDYARLVKLATPAPSRVDRAVLASAAVHRVERFDAQRIQVESEYDLIARGSGSLQWQIPVAMSREIRASLNGEPVPIRVEPGGTSGVVGLPRPGRYRLLIKRLTGSRLESGREVSSLAINPVPSARVIVLPPRDRSPLGEVATRGRSEITPEKSITGELGPADRIEIRWPPVNGGGSRSSVPVTVEEIALWDVHPAGDRLRAQWTFPSLEKLDKIEEIWVTREPGLVLRSVTAPGGAIVACREVPERPEWILSIDPPLSAGATLRIDCWRPLVSRPATVRPRGAVDDGEPSVRAIPLLEPLGFERVTGVIGARRPGDWVGRLSPIFGSEPISDEAFVGLWGNLPDDPLTFAGATRFAREGRVSLVTGRPPSVIRVKPTVQIRIESGRLNLVASADLLQASGNSQRLIARLPEKFRVTRVDGNGLVDWSIAAENRLELILDQSRSDDRRDIRIEGWIPLNSDPLQTRTVRHRLPMPWIDWISAEVAGGLITISSWTKPELVGSNGVLTVASETLSDAGPGAARFRQSFKVNDSGSLGTLSWESSPPSVQVSVASQLEIGPDNALWVAVLRFHVIGGPLDTLNVKIPARWASAASLRVPGDDFQLTTEIKDGSAYWSITPRRPIWGTERVVLRATMALPADGVLVHPEVAPLGNGAVDTYLRVINSSGHPLTALPSAGLQSTADGSRFSDSEFLVDNAKPAGSYHLVREGSVLRMEWPRGLPAELAAGGGDSARTAFADIVAIVSPDRSTTIRAFYDVVPNTGRLWNFEMPRSASLVAQTRDGVPVTPLESGSGRLSIPITAGQPTTIGLVLKNLNLAPAVSESKRSFALPRAGTGPTPTLLTVYTNGRADVSTDRSVLDPISMAQLEFAHAERITQRITELLAVFDRSSGKDHERLVSLIVDHEIALRASERSERASRSVGSRPSKPGVDAESTRIRDARGALASLVQAAGLGDDWNSAQEYLGQTAGRPDRRLFGLIERESDDPFSRPGEPHAFVGRLPGIDGPGPSQSIEVGAVSVPFSAGLDSTSLAFVLGLLATISVARRGSSSSWIWNGVAFTSAVGLTAVAGGLLLVVASISVALAARVRTVWVAA